jgi:hypothetical protein
MASLRKRLRNLFATNVIVRAVGKDKLRVVDTNRLQNGGNLINTKLADRYTRLHGANKHRVGGIHGGYDSNYYMHQNRMQLYTDYEMMDRDPIIHAALDIYSDESTLEDQFGDILTIRTNDSKLQKVLYNLFYDILNIDFNMWSWIRNVTKYGDFFLKLDIADEIGIINARPMSSYEIERYEEYNVQTGEYDIKFKHIANAEEWYDVFEIAHFRLLSDSNFLPYGRSMLEGARQEFQKLTMLEDAMLIHRIMRAPEKRIFKIDIGNIPPNEVDAFMEQIINKMKKIPHIDQQTGNYNLKFNLNNMIEDFFLPVRGGNSQTQIDTLPGMTWTGTDDIEYVKNKMMAALKIPKPFLGFDEGVEGKTTLASMDMRFARTIERIQKIVVSELYKIGIIHLASQGYEGEDLVNFDLALTAYIYEYIFNMSEEQWLQERTNVIEDLKLRFRQNQIEQEGNDPTITGVSYGTPHDLASMHMSSDEVEEKDEGGRPYEGIKSGQHQNAMGWDPLGKKTMKQAFDPENQKTAFQPEVRQRKMSMTSENQNLVNYFNRKKGSKIITETMNSSSKDEDSGTMLDENNIL